ncbi:hypothetical protein [Brachyspira hampsonii]|uniref:hypothetical protein n=1 Tax=Brachyspira hampsonii TaxID=1287055 RepID=UPI000D3C0C73|nr:hypothetical protein [Brachyspira hampsonii]PTY39729.1 hypothetical protein DQ06_03715 [Brachyspira hampsonii bv. II]
MSKKISTIFLTLFLVGILSVSCSNKDTTDPKGIEQYNGNSYVSAESYTIPKLGTGYLWISVKDSKVAISASDNNANEPTYQGYFSVTGSGSDYSFSTDYYGQANGVEGTLKFSDTSVTVNFTKNPDASQGMLNTDIVCNKK